MADFNQRGNNPEGAVAGGYYRFLKAIAELKHKQHEERLEWIGGHFDPESFDAEKATKKMRRGLPNWRLI